MTTALITGASAGLGQELARLFAQDGHSLVLVARRLDRLETLASELRSRHPAVSVTVLPEDLATPGAGRVLFDKVRSLGLEIEFLINNAGFGNNGEFHAQPLEKELKLLDLNIRTLVELTHLFLPEMLKRRSGFILNVGSTAGFQPGPYMATYYASKAFVNSFSEALHDELHGSGVSCTVLAPGATATEFAQKSGVESALLFRTGLVASAPDVARAGYDGLLQRRALVVPGLRNKILIQLLRASPRAWIRKTVGFVNKSKK